jgi:hypothetical protein
MDPKQDLTTGTGQFQPTRVVGMLGPFFLHDRPQTAPVDADLFFELLEFGMDSLTKSAWGLDRILI